MDKQERYAMIVAEVLEAVECARLGEKHSRLNQMMIRTMAMEASFYPLCPEELIPIERRKYHMKPVDINREIYLDFKDRRQGRFGFISQE
ncbi:hypothetical protein [Sodalis praecaptivus]|uniref:hypothetical protein n=1 Tax=Sodalis TaxID=84565 RepID=UPI00046D8A08|nr:hypothetical protein [Sodalis praecaptivus]